ncbi:MAG: VWA domain-containing protein [Nitriliruptor sp.]|nr:MAG: VWA domain-containing protein [Nitriliruptor sp.]
MTPTDDVYGRLGSRPRSLSLSALFAVALAALWPFSALAAEDEPELESLDIVSVRADGYPEIELVVNAPQRDIGDDVPASAFTLTEDGAVRDSEVQRLSSDDLEVALIIDTSGSMQGAPLDAAREAALEFVSAMPPVVEISVVEFSTQATLLSGFTTDRDETTEALSGLSAGGWTAMYDAIDVVLDAFDDRGSERRSIVLLTDGGDNRSQATLDGNVSRLGPGEEILHIIELITTERPVPRERFGRDDPGIDEVDLQALQALVDAADQGFVASPEDLDAISSVYEEIAESLVNQYELTYTSEAYDDTQLLVRIDHEGVVLEGTVGIDLPPDPAADASDAAPVESPSEPAEEAEEEPEPSEVALSETTQERWDWLPGADRPWVLPSMFAVVVGGFVFTVFFIVRTLRGY